MGTVYLAVDTESGAEVALKLIEQGPDADRQEIAAAERRGAMLQEQLARLDKRVTQIRSYGEMQGFFYIEMEYVQGHDLAEVLRSGPLGVPFAARIALDLCEVLQYAHTLTVSIEGQQHRGVVHGDIKPRNIRITPQGEVRVLDFGIAKALSLTRTFTQIQFGSSQYSSPERLLHGEVNIASDLWSVAVVLFETLTGRPYFEAETGPRLDSLIRGYREVRPMPGQLPVPLAAILRKALQPAPEDRYRTAHDFASDLKAFLSGQRTVAESVPDVSDSERTRRTSAALSQSEDTEPTRRTVFSAGGKSPPTVASVPVRRRPVSRRRRQVAATAVLILFLLTAGFVSREVSIWRRGDELARELQSEHLTDLNIAWTRYQQLSDQNHLPLILHTPRRTILDRLTAAADRVILEYRNSETPSVSENDWMRGQTVLAKALELAPGDREIRSRMYLCDAHVLRIRGTSRPSGRLLNDARARFEQARELMPKSPDPYLGLARLYVYALRDVDKAEEALKAASKRGHEIGRREKAQLGDGYRDRAERLMREADKATGLPEEKEYLKRAQSDFRRAQDLYQDIVPFAGSTASLRKVLESAETADSRLKAIREGA